MRSVVLEDSFKNADPSVASQMSRYQELKGGADVMMMCSVPPGHWPVQSASSVRPAWIFRSSQVPVAMAVHGMQSVPGLSNYYYLNNSADAGVTEPRPAADAFQNAYKAKWGERPGSGQGITGYSVDRRLGACCSNALARWRLTKSVPNWRSSRTSRCWQVSRRSRPTLHTNVNRPMLIVSMTDGKPEPLGYYDMRIGDYVGWWK